MKNNSENTKKTDYRLYIIAVILSSILLFFIINFLINFYNPSKALIHIAPDDNKDIIPVVTLFTNNMNNILTWFGAILTLITLITAGVFLAYYNRLENNINNKVDDINKTVKAIKYDVARKLIYINKLKAETDKLKQDNKDYSKEIKRQIKYSDQTSLLIFIIIEKFGQSTGDKNLLKEILHEYQRKNLYSTNQEELNVALNYFSENGTEEDIEDLERILNSISDEEIKNRISQIIGNITERIKQIKLLKIERERRTNDLNSGDRETVLNAVMYFNVNGTTENIDKLNSIKSKWADDDEIIQAVEKALEAIRKRNPANLL